MQNKEFTIKDFELEEILMNESGHWSGTNPYYLSAEGKFDINYSSILTFLIQKAGSICKHYASDLFITWSGLEERLKNFNYTGEKILFGFRECGVDSNAFVLSRYNRGCMEEIKELYLLEIKVKKDINGYGYILGKNIYMEFGKTKIVKK